MTKPKDLSDSQWKWLRRLAANPPDGEGEAGDAGFYCPLEMQGRTLIALLACGYLERADTPSFPPRSARYLGRPEYKVTDRGRAAVKPSIKLRW